MSKTRRICLNMIVKNESHVILRCLESVKDVIDYWVISDTGSTDGTQEIIKNFFKKSKIAGFLTEDPWINFEHNRNNALSQAKGHAKYILFMDADDHLEKSDGFRFNNLITDSYFLKMERKGHSYATSKLVRDAVPWAWKGVLHEYLDADIDYTTETLSGPYCIRAPLEGARSRNLNKYLDDAKVLETALVSDTGNARYRFYLAQSYRDSGCWAESLSNYEIRAGMGGWDEEVYYSLLEIARNKKRLEHPEPKILEAYLEAHHYRPQRLEAIHEAVEMCRIGGNYHLGQLLGWDFRNEVKPSDVLFLEDDVYAWKFKDELSICAAYATRAQAAADMMAALLNSDKTPREQKPRLATNLRFALMQVANSFAVPLQLP